MGKKELNARKHNSVSKLQAYEFDIKYVKGNKNVVVDALSIRPEMCSLTKISADWKSDIVVEYSKNKFDCEVMEHNIHDDRYKVVYEIIYYEDYIYISSSGVCTKGKHYGGYAQYCWITKRGVNQ